MSQVITGYFYFLLKYMFHAGFVTFHNSQQNTMKLVSKASQH